MQVGYINLGFTSCGGLKLAETMISPSHAVPTLGPPSREWISWRKVARSHQEDTYDWIGQIRAICMTSPKRPMFWKSSNQSIRFLPFGLRFSQPWDHGSLPSSKVL